jgi:hypothetical protein
MTIATLFRGEVADARKHAWLGEVQIAQPLPITIAAAVSLALVASMIAYAWLGTYTRRVHASGALMPSAGLITVASAARPSRKAIRYARETFSLLSTSNPCQRTGQPSSASSKS